MIHFLKDLNKQLVVAVVTHPLSPNKSILRNIQRSFSWNLGELEGAKIILSVRGQTTDIFHAGVMWVGDTSRNDWLGTKLFNWKYVPWMVDKTGSESVNSGIIY
jgi:hypothetical protein